MYKSGLIILQLLICAFLFNCAGRNDSRHATTNAQNLKVSRVVLYQNGIGYFERTGQINNNKIEIQVRPDQINDLLKSLTIIDSKGKAISVSLPLEKQAEQILDDLPSQVRYARGFMDVLRQFRGAHVHVRGKKGSVRGRILGLETIYSDKRTDDLAPVPEYVATFKNRKGELIVYPALDIESIELLDHNLEIGLEKSLDVSLNSGSWNSNTVTIALTNAPSRKINLSYIVEMPRWKPAYRIVLEENKPPLLQGWAVVDNISGEDWDQVSLSLVAGTPMSFRYDLHSPQFTNRIDLTPTRPQTALAPVIETPGSDLSNLNSSARDMLQKAHAPSREALARSFDHEISEDEVSYVGAEKMAEEMRLISAASPDYDLRQELQEQLSQATGEKMGSLFRYDITEPITVKNRTSTLVSIVNAEVTGKEVVLFRPELTRAMPGSHPYRAVMFKNDSGFTLESGPVAAYSNGTFAGEGFIEQTKEGLSTFLTFSIDNQVTLKTKEEHLEDGATLQKIIDGILEVQTLSIKRSTYSISNLHNTPITAYVKAQAPHGYSLRKQVAGTVETPEAFFIPIEIKAKSKDDLIIEWATPVKRQVSIDSSRSDEILNVFLNSGKVPLAIAPVLKEVVEIRGQLNEIEEQIKHYNNQNSMHTKDQSRIRDNLNILRRTQGNEELQKQLVQRISEIEKSLSKISANLVTLSEEEATLKGRIRVLIRGITLNIE